ncbi:MAG: hypothetical protein JNM76_14610 [Betaproteobacteria bacterium]|nr:hypothetical protein [Betaproteobacteria bacterium]
MQTTEQFFEDFQAAGMLVPAAWTPSVDAGGGAAVSTNVRYRNMDDDYADGMVVAQHPSIEYPTSWLPGLIEGETVTLDLSSLGGSASATFKVRAAPRRGLDGTRAKAFLKAV